MEKWNTEVGNMSGEKFAGGDWHFKGRAEVGALLTARQSSAADLGLLAGGSQELW